MLDPVLSTGASLIQGYTTLGTHPHPAHQYSSTSGRLSLPALTRLTSDLQPYLGVPAHTRAGTWILMEQGQRALGALQPHLEFLPTGSRLGPTQDSYIANTASGQFSKAVPPRDSEEWVCSLWARCRVVSNIVLVSRRGQRHSSCSFQGALHSTQWLICCF